MNKLLSILLFACLAVTGLTAQVFVTGSVLIGGESGVPVPDYPVVLNAPIDGVNRTELTNTDENGVYVFDLADVSLNGPVEWSVGTLDICSNGETNVNFEFTPNQLEVIIDLIICDSINPPPPMDTCLAFFEYIQVEPLTFQFTTLTSDFLEIDSLLWEFGDGNTSDQLGPQHTYTDNGAYPVTLTVYTPTCTAMNTNTVFAFDSISCNCNAIYAPVCAIGPNGEVITFSNECEAECSGFPFNQLFDCSNENCVCPTFVAPVCVVLPNSQDTLTFTNHCFAECEGYGPDQWFECDFPNTPDTTGCYLLPFDPVCATGFGEFFSFYNLCEYEESDYFGFPLVTCDSIPENCNCLNIYDPVCVIDTLTGAIFTFSNSCYAECEGYGINQQFSCGPDTLDCNFFPFPVCVAVSNSPDSLISFETACDALDAGYTFEELQDCETTDVCVAQINFYNASADGLTFDFQASNLNGVGFETYDWDFGDGTSSNETSPSHTFPDYGDYLVSVTATSGDCTTTSTFIVSVIEGNGNGYDCQAFFFFEQPDSSNLLTYQFVNFTFFNNNSPEVSWDFGDGTTSNELNPLHTFPSEGSYTVTLSIDDSLGCQSSLGIAINAGENTWYGDLDCRAWFLPVIDVENNEVYFNNWSSFDAVEFFWDFGDNNLSNDFAPVHQYADAGVYTVELTITSESGCVNTYSVTIDIAGDNFTSNPSFSLISSIDEAGKVTQPVIEAFPNPTRDFVNIRWENGTSGRYDWSLVNIAGQRIQTGTGNGNGTTGQFELNLTNEVPGIYLLQIRTPEGLQVLRLSKTN